MIQVIFSVLKTQSWLLYNIGPLCFEVSFDNLKYILHNIWVPGSAQNLDLYNHYDAGDFSVENPELNTI